MTAIRARHPVGAGIAPWPEYRGRPAFGGFRGRPLVISAGTPTESERGSERDHFKSKRARSSLIRRMILSKRSATLGSCSFGLAHDRVRNVCNFLRSCSGVRSRRRAAPIAVFVVILDGRHRIDAGEPAVQVDIGAAFGTKRAKSLDLRLTADGAMSWLINRRHGTNVGPRDRRGERKPSRSFRTAARPLVAECFAPPACPPVLIPGLGPPKLGPQRLAIGLWWASPPQRATGGDLGGDGPAR